MAEGQLPQADQADRSAQVGATDDGGPHDGSALLDSSARVQVQAAMTAGAGAVRSAQSLRSTAAALRDLALAATSTESGPASWETTNLLHIGQVLTLAATLREETRGGHVRSDHPDQVDPRWRGHTLIVRGVDGTLSTTFEPVPEQDLA